MTQVKKKKKRERKQFLSFVIQPVSLWEKGPWHAANLANF